jgi:hypothetical protein
MLKIGVGALPSTPRLFLIIGVITGVSHYIDLNYYKLMINGHGFTQDVPSGAARAIAARERAMIALMNVMVFAVGREVENLEMDVLKRAGRQSW